MRKPFSAHYGAIGDRGGKEQPSPLLSFPAGWLLGGTACSAGLLHTAGFARACPGEALCRPALPGQHGHGSLILGTA